MLSLDDDELRAAAMLLTGVAPEGEFAASVALGVVRLRARSLLSGPETTILADTVAMAVGTLLWAESSVAITVQRRDAHSSMHVRRRGTTLVGHRRERLPDGEVHGFVAYASVQEVVEDVMQVLDAPEQTKRLTVQWLQLETLERARHAAAAGDRTEVALAVTDPALIEALLTPHCIAHLVRERPEPAGLSVLTSKSTVWTFSHASPDDTLVRVDRPSLAALREQLAELWAAT